jgi:FkbM family methyltransferase
LSILNTFQFIFSHPLTKIRKIAAFKRWLRWQLGSRIISGSSALQFVENSRLLAQPGMTGATGNIYCGLHEPNDMGFLLHFLREKDLFMDVGANIGSYTVLASGVIGAETICFEPIPTTYQHLLDNIYLNRLVDRVQALNVAVGSEDGEIEMMADQDTVNRVVSAGEYSGLTIKVPVVTVDKILAGRVPKLIKIDVEGYETLVLESARQTLENKALEAVIIELNGSGSVLGFDEGSIRRHFIDLGFTACTYDVRTRLLQEENDEIKNISDNTLYVRNIEATQDRLRHARYFNVLGINI